MCENVSISFLFSGVALETILPTLASFGVDYGLDFGLDFLSDPLYA